MKKILAIQLTALLIITGALSGMFVYTDVYDEVKSGIVDVLCLSCIKLQPKTSYDFTFKTADGQPHPEFVKDTLKTKGPILIQYGEDGCKACELMIDNVMKPYFNLTYPEKPKSFETEVTIDNINFYYIYIYIDDHQNSEREESWETYDKEHIRGFPQFTIITLEYHHGGEIKPYYTTLYGRFEGENYDKAKQTFTGILKESNELYDRNIEGYK